MMHQALGLQNGAFSTGGMFFVETRLSWNLALSKHETNGGFNSRSDPVSTASQLQKEAQIRVGNLAPRLCSRKSLGVMGRVLAEEPVGPY